MIEIKAPYRIPESDLPKVFLAGSIEEGTAEEWQEHVVKSLAHENIMILNPRRESWDKTWVQSIENPEFKKQVLWELDALSFADSIIFYFDPNTKAPITLLELGLHAAQQHQKLFVVCPNGYWRKGNVDIVCEKYGIEQFETLDNLIVHMKKLH
jgi:hypothetical protein